ncbi:MAG: hypothetical protein LRY44_02440 [Candidatus Pacebacteria bacterium]|nr:hypothetical protein [Candidatus Paceibacterota bacterium]MCD8563848.1 hypothetical protein [Candidatus Paceibacterota bacterium]
MNKQVKSSDGVAKYKAQDINKIIVLVIASIQPGIFIVHLIVKLNLIILMRRNHRHSVFGGVSLAVIFICITILFFKIGKKDMQMFTSLKTQAMVFACVFTLIFVVSIATRTKK